jgi:hypothetical protein
MDFRDFLRAIFKANCLEEATAYFSNAEAYRRDAAKNDFRSPEQLDSINSDVDNKAEEMSIDFIDELRAKGVKNPDDLLEKSQIVEQVLLSYRKKLVEWLQNQ